MGIYTGGRFGLFDTLMERSQDPMFDAVPGFAKKSLCAITAGGLAAAAGNPADLSLIRMQADSLLPAAQRRNYRGCLIWTDDDRAGREEGVTLLCAVRHLCRSG